ncbi:hypothetical protein SEA_BILLNYE_242 [Streptomyces phage BillNye]|uniref:Uncharacterized protein n=2 Tax=Wilnyevirus billnye TaxID=2560486 RepID=A0A2L1IW45_9CAUD|nr:hypothetical protein FDJ30_gp020 [Streptomyces phage BillNye]AVD99411.1 hypothetical protein SEA_BILLNYE_242 [Streptomyces phage BillNye]QBZ72494.1 hypothetical protein SEA_CIRCINUS_241 [Streptomyces phage Circinus]
MQRITVDNVRNAFARYVRACEAWGYDVTGWQMSEGEYGAAWRVGVKGNGSARKLPGVDDYGIVGYSRREVYEMLHTISRTLEDVPIGGVK